MTVGILLRTGPYTAQAVDTVYEIGKRFLVKGHMLKIFLFEDGLYVINKRIASPQERNIMERMRELVGMGAEIRGCGICAKFRGQGKNDIIDDVKLAGMAYLSAAVKESDIFLLEITEILICIGEGMEMTFHC